MYKTRSLISFHKSINILNFFLIDITLYDNKYLFIPLIISFGYNVSRTELIALALYDET